MLTKIFTTIGGNCPFGFGRAIDSPACRQCEHYYRTGTSTFFWCKRGDVVKDEQTSEIVGKRKPGRPRKNAGDVVKLRKPGTYYRERKTDKDK